IQRIADKNKVFKSYIGQGYYDVTVPAVIQRNVLENPGWYTQYTPYQAEIAQGRLQALLNFQTAVADLTGLEIANASLLDEATAAAEAMFMLYSARKNKSANVFLVTPNIYPQTLDVLQTRAVPFGVEILVADLEEKNLTEDIFAALVQYPAADGTISDYAGFTTAAHDRNITVCAIADLMSLALLTPPGEWGADVVVGNSQRFGVPMGFGGPHAAFLRPKRLTNVIFRGALLVLLPMLAVIMLCVWLCRHVSNISAGIRHLPIFVPHRLYWPLWLLSMRYIMVPNGYRIYSPVLLTYQS